MKNKGKARESEREIFFLKGSDSKGKLRKPGKKPSKKNQNLLQCFCWWCTIRLCTNEILSIGVRFQLFLSTRSQIASW